MELTERYEIVISYVGRIRPGVELIEDVWSTAILEEYKKSAIYVNAIIDERSLVCVDCSKREKVFVVNAIRNPIQTPDKDAYYKALGNIVFQVRRDLNAPYTLISIGAVQVSYFPYNP
ncbi:hypothetical protein [Lachnoclostridium phytofermentans]|uniref:Uncharacterized protein n=1 Tax=Lachnoclostridium phytofermentans (strain ATCC 700394 / DSM 18823 / ISDg) TaxID=357809 RepID=A9KHM9_LACP7|nr:hypothetical protein [Lachnoclostridium phytofermentans]ABX42314.1 hypothetical protein Cphy_1946 [Lachnoclostridium phytofermentans ISDg]